MDDGFIAVQEGIRNMENGLCFGKWYSGGDRACRLCEVREECMIAMQDEKKMPCYGQYDSENYACKSACHLGGVFVEPGDSNESVCSILTRGVEVPAHKLTEVGQMVEKAEVQGPTEEATQEQVAVPVEEPTEGVAEPVAEPEGVQAEQVAPGKKKSKKAVIREAIYASPDGISADDIVTRIMDAGLATEEEMEKTRHYVVMSISHLRKAGKVIELRDGKYVLTGDQSG